MTSVFHLCIGGKSELADIILNEEQERLLKEAKNFNGRRAVIANLDHNDLPKPWTDGMIPYVMDPKIIGKHHICTFTCNVSQSISIS